MVRRNVRGRTVGRNTGGLRQRVSTRPGEADRRQKKNEKEKEEEEEDDDDGGSSGNGSGGNDGGIRYPVSPCCSLLLKYLT